MSCLKLSYGTVHFHGTRSCPTTSYVSQSPCHSTFQPSLMSHVPSNTFSHHTIYVTHFSMSHSLICTFSLHSRVELSIPHVHVAQISTSNFPISHSPMSHSLMSQYPNALPCGRITIPRHTLIYHTPTHITLLHRTAHAYISHLTPPHRPDYSVILPTSLPHAHYPIHTFIHQD